MSEPMSEQKNENNPPSNDANPVKQKRVFTQEILVDNEAADSLGAAQTFDNDQSFHADEAPESPLEMAAQESELSLDWLNEPSKKRKPWTLWLLMSAGGLCVVQLVWWLWQAFVTSPVLASAWAAVLTAVILWAASVVLAEWRGLKVLKHQAQNQRDAKRLLSSVQQGEAREFCNALISNLPTQVSINEGVQRWQQAIQPHHQDNEVVTLFDQMVLSECDKYAEQTIREHATQTALLVALSPVAFIDVFIVLARSIRLTQQVSRCYGIKHGYWSRIRLIRQTIHQMLFVAISELLIDVAGSVLGFELLGKISARAVQGIGAGLMAGRLGYNALQLVRPISQPKLVEKGTRKLSKQLMETLLKQVKKS